MTIGMRAQNAAVVERRRETKEAMAVRMAIPKAGHFENRLSG